MAALLRNRVVRGLLIALAALVALALAAPLLVPAAKVRDLVVARVRQATGAEVAFGRASVRLLPRLSVAVADGQIHGTGEALARATGQASPLVRYDVALGRLEVSVAVGPLLRRRVEIGGVRLVRPDISVVTLPPAPADTAAGAGAPPAPAPAFALALAGLEVRDGALRWSEQGTARSVTVEGWQQDLRGGDLLRLATALQAFAGAASAQAGDRDATLGLETRVASLALAGFGARPPLALRDLALRAEVTVPASADRVRFAVGRAAWGALALAGEGELGPAAGGGRRLTARWRLDEASLPPLVESLLSLAPPPPGAAGAWLAADPVTAGGLALAGSLDLPWPVPAGPAAAGALLAGLGAEGTLAGAKVTLPLGQGTAALDAVFDVAGGTLRLSRLSARDEEGRLDLSGTAELPLAPAGGRLRADLGGTADVAALAAAAALVPRPAPAPGRAAGPGLEAYRLTGTARLSVKADVAAAPGLAQPEAWRALLQGAGLRGVDAQATVTDLTVAGQWLEPPLRVASLEARTDLRGATIRLRGVAHPMVRGDGTVTLTRLGPAPHAECDLSLRRFDADRLTAMVTGKPVAALAAPAGPGVASWLDWLAGPALAAAPVAAASPGELLPAKLTAAYRARADTLVAGKLRYEAVDVTGTLAGRVFEAPSAAARLGGGTVAGRARVDYASDPWGTLSFDAEVKDVPAAVLTQPYAPAVAKLWEGKVGGKVTGGCGLRDQKAVLASLALEGLAVSTNGVIHGTDLLAGVSQYLGARQDMKEIRFKDLSHHLAVRDGRYVISDLVLTGFDTDWTGDGWIAFDGGLDLTLTVKLPAGFRPELGSFSALADALKGPDGRLALTMRLTGQAAQPTVALDLTGAKAKAGDQLRDKAKQGADRLLDRLRRR